MTKRIARVGTFLLAVCAVSLLFVGPGVAAHRGTQATNLLIWVDSPQKPSIEKSAAAWGKAPVTVLVHSFGGIRDDLKTVKPEHAPDIIIGIAVPQGSGGDPYHMYPFFSGLGGYVFGRNKAGLLDASDIGIANKTFLKNSTLIDKWNKEGLINSKVDYNTAKNAFLKKQAAFWITGPWESDTLKSSGIKFKIIQLPKIKFAAVPFLGVQGMMVTKYATDHGLDALAKDFVSSYMMKSSAQLDLANNNGRTPANIVAQKGYKDPVQAQFGKASVGGVPMPNIPQMGSVWTDFGQAWVKSTQGAGATKARIAFATAAKNIANKIG